MSVLRITFWSTCSFDRKWVWSLEKKKSLQLSASCSCFIELFPFLPGRHFRLSLFYFPCPSLPLCGSGGLRERLQSWRRQFNSAPLIWCPMLPCFQVSHMLQRATSTLWCGWARWPAKVKALRILVSPGSGSGSPDEVNGGGAWTGRWDGGLYWWSRSSWWPTTHWMHTCKLSTVIEKKRGFHGQVETFPFSFHPRHLHMSKYQP